MDGAPLSLPSIGALPPVRVEETLAGAPGVVDLWCFFYESMNDPATLAAYDALLTPDERTRHGRFHFERDQRLFLATRALVRTVLSQYAPVAPADWRFGAGEHGKPHIAPPRAPHLWFNLSNTRGLVVCAVSLAHEALGTDVEAIDRRGELLAIADRSFSPFERAALRALPAEAQLARFFAYWTLKESYIKARGLGLALPLDAFSFLLDDRDEVGVAFEPRLGDDASRWRFALHQASPRHMLAVGVDTGGAPLSLRAARVVPLHGAVPFDPVAR